jgi:hypothetical protein
LKTGSKNRQLAELSVALQQSVVYARRYSHSHRLTGVPLMRLAALTIAVAAFTALPAMAQKVPVWRMAQDQQFNIPKCAAPAKLVEGRTAAGRIVWRCVTPK